MFGATGINDQTPSILLHTGGETLHQAITHIEVQLDLLVPAFGAGLPKTLEQRFLRLAALLTKMSTRPNALAVSATKRSTSEGIRRSALTATAFRPSRSPRWPSHQ